VRAVAVVFLLMTATEIFGCELLGSPACELSSSPTDSQQGGNPSGDECMCCCHHVVPGPGPMALAPLELVALVVPTVLDFALEFFTPAIDQPPRA
jgi:hypothetical protein